MISEKGGAERREVFDRTELSVGRVQGNDLMLPKGNVSKRHARLLYRDGRFIVTDLNSTNGTYVNRRRISQATIVREGDRIYIGDFVLRIELGEGGGDLAPAEPAAAAARCRASRSRARRRAKPRAGHRRSRSRSTSRTAGRATRSSRATAHADRGARRRKSICDRARRRQPLRGTVGRLAAEQCRRRFERRRRSAEPRVARSIASRWQPGRAGARAVRPRRCSRRAGRGARPAHRAPAVRADCALRGQRRAALGVPSELWRGTRGPSWSSSARSAHAGRRRRTEITVPRFDQVNATRGGRSFAVEPPFSSDASLRLALARLCRASGAALGAEEPVVERRLPNGVRISALLAGVGRSASVVVIRKPARSSATLEELVRRGTVSRAMATFLTQCVAARCNVLVVGSRDSGMGALVGALAAAAGDRRVLALQDLDDMAPSAATRLPIGDRAGADRATWCALRRASGGAAGGRSGDPRGRGRADRSDRRGRGRRDRGSPSPDAAARPGAPARRVERALARIEPRGGARVVAGAFDVAIEVARLRDGR